MTVVIDTSVLVDVLRDYPGARQALGRQRQRGALHASELTRVEILTGMRSAERQVTRALIETVTWVPVGEEIGERAGELGRTWLRSHSGIDLADLVIASTAHVLGAALMTRNVKHFPMFPGLVAPY